MCILSFQTNFTSLVSVYFVGIIRSLSIQQVLHIYKNCGENTDFYLFIPLIFWGRKDKCPPLNSVPLPAAHMVTVRTNNKNMPPFWTSTSGQVCQMPFQRFFTLKLRGEINSLGAELGRCEPMNSRQRWFLGEKVRYGG